MRSCTQWLWVSRRSISREEAAQRKVAHILQKAINWLSPSYWLISAAVRSSFSTHNSSNRYCELDHKNYRQRRVCCHSVESGWRRGHSFSVIIAWKWWEIQLMNIWISVNCQLNVMKKIRVRKENADHGKVNVCCGEQDVIVMLQRVRRKPHEPWGDETLQKARQSESLNANRRDWKMVCNWVALINSGMNEVRKNRVSETKCERPLMKAIY